MSRKSKRQTQFACQPRAEIAGAQKVYGNVGVFARISMHPLRRLRFSKIAAQLVQKLWKILACRYLRTAQGPCCRRVAAWGTAQTQINAAGKERLKRAELFGNRQGGAI